MQAGKMMDMVRGIKDKPPDQDVRRTNLLNERRL